MAASTPLAAPTLLLAETLRERERYAEGRLRQREQSSAIVNQEVLKQSYY